MISGLIMVACTGLVIMVSPHVGYSQGSSPVKQQKVVQVDVRDSSVRAVLWMIRNQSGQQVVFDNSLPQLDNKISVELKNVSALGAVRKALEGSGLQATLASDNETIVVRMSGSGADTAEKSDRGQISGRVVDSAGREGLNGAAVTVIGTSISALTNSEGAFVISNVPAGQRTVSVRLLGYSSRQVTVTVGEAPSAPLVIALTPSAASLNEVVTTATGQQRRVEIANDIVRIDADEIRERAPVRSITDMIDAAQVPGVLISRASGDPGAPSRIRLRGIGSISESNDPVMIVDGVWVDASVRSPSPFENIDPANIETIEIVRGPSAATLYGQDAANGVIVITTKKGVRGPARWDFSYNRDWGQPYGRRPVTYKGFGYQPATGIRMECDIADAAATRCIQDSVAIYDPNNSLLIREGGEINDRFSAQLSGGSDAVRYALTASASNTIGVRRVAPITRTRLRLLGYDHSREFDRPSTLDRRTLSSNTTFIPRDNLTIGMTITGGYVSMRDNEYNVYYGATRLLYDAYSTDTLAMLDDRNRIDAVRKPTRQSNVMFASNIGWNPGVWVTSASVGVEGGFDERSEYTAWTQCDFGAACSDSSGSRSQNSDNRMMYSVRFNTSRTLSLGRADRFLSIRPTFGGDFRRTQRSGLQIRKENLPPGENSMAGGDLTGSFYNRASHATAGWYLNSTFGIFNRIYFDAGLRQDIGSAVSVTSSSQSLLPKLGGSWLISDEGFWPANRMVSTMRLRGAIGYATVQPNIADVYGSYRSNYRFIDGRFVRSVEITGPGNPILRPERSAETEIGIDADFWDDRVNLIATYAHKENRNTLVVRSLPTSATGSAPSTLRLKQNIARVRNRSLELSLAARVIETSNSLAQFNYTLTLSENLVTRVGDGVTPYSGAGGASVVAGYPLAGVWAPRIVGYRDVNDDGYLVVNELILSDESAYLGSSIPRYTAGYGVSLATMQNRIRFDARFAYQSKYIQTYVPGQSGNLFGLEDVTAPLSEQAFALASLSGRRPVTDLRWNSASLTYYVSSDIARRLRARSLAVSLQGNNLALWTNYAGRDPGVNTSILTSEAMRDDGVVSPRPRLFVLDFKLGY